MIQLKGGYEASDPRLGRIPEFDERSRDFRARTVLEFIGAREPINRTWYLKPRIDQLQTPRCVGASRTHDLAASPENVRQEDGRQLDFAFASKLYAVAQTLDEWAGENYEGTSVLAGLKAAAQLGLIGEYRWGFSLDDVVLSVGHLGTVIAGTWWKSRMFRPQPSGLLVVDGSNEGGHAYCLRGVAVTRDLQRRWLKGGAGAFRPNPLFRVTNTWGLDWGVRGDAFIWADDMWGLLREDGESSVVTSALRRL